MAPTPLKATRRYISPEVTAIYLLDECADINTPTREELDAETSVDVTAEVAATSGWEVGSDRVGTPDLGSKKTGRIAGRVNPGDAQISFYGSEDTDDVRRVLKRGDRRFVFIADGGDVPDQSARMFEVEVSSVTPTTDVAGTEAARVVVDFAINDWAEDVTIPALT